MKTQSNASCECSGYNTPNGNTVYTKMKEALGHTKNTVIIGADYTKIRDKGTMNTDLFLVLGAFKVRPILCLA